MLRRDFGRASRGVRASRVLFVSAKRAGPASGADFPKTPGLTDYVGRFVTTTTYEEIPEQVSELGTKSILDGLGLALAGARAESRCIYRKYVEQIGVCNRKATIIGSAQKPSPRFAALLN